MELLLLAQEAVLPAGADHGSARAPAASNLKAYAYLIFIGIVILFLGLDLGVFHREAHEVSFKEALTWSIIWVSCGLSFAAFVYYAYENHWLGLGLNTPRYDQAAGIVLGTVAGAEAAKQYLTGYVVEKSLSMDNVFLIAVVFGYFAVPAKYQHRVLFWGIIGALVMRGVMIGVGAELVHRFEWILIIFGLFLVLTAMKMALMNSHADPGKNPAVKLAKKIYPVSDQYDGQRFFTKINGVKHMTPLFLALLIVEVTDLIFAVDSIPAIFAITPDPFIVFTSNIFAILGLRALYFCLAALILKFRFLKPALIIILLFVGAKLLLLSVPPYLHTMAGWVGSTMDPMKGIKVDTSISLGVVLGMLCLAVIASVLFPAKAPHPAHEAPGTPGIKS